MKNKDQQFVAANLMRQKSLRTVRYRTSLAKLNQYLGRQGHVISSAKLLMITN